MKPKINKQTYRRLKEKKNRPEKKSLCVGTIFCDDSPLQREWFDLQLRFLKSTTIEFDHVTFCGANKLSTDLFKTKSHLIHKPHTAISNEAHVNGLKSILEHFKQNKEKYKNFLFIDSDAFPIRKNWYSLLLNKMGGNYEIAICLRNENLEQRLHSSILFARSPALEHIDFSVSQIPGGDLCGQKEIDVSCLPYQTDRRSLVYPLLRSNKKEIHPLLYGVYYDMFYHNGCGSGRKFNMRAGPYWNHMTKDVELEKNRMNLFSSPGQFIRNLAGWNPEMYPEV